MYVPRPVDGRDRWWRRRQWSRAWRRRPRSPLWPLLAAVLTVTGAAYWTLDAASRRDPELMPRHRAEALCFALALPPPFEPPMAVHSSSALVRGRFGVTTPAPF